MGRIYFAQELDNAASWWRIFRRDGVALGFTTHDRDLWFDGILHRAAPGMVPSAIRRTIGFDDDPGDVEGALSHREVSEADLAAGRYDGARIACGVVDWQTGESAALYHGRIAAITREGGSFRAQLESAKAQLAVDPVPLTSPSCRATFCGPGCGLGAAAFQQRTQAVSCDPDANRVTLALADASAYRFGRLRWLAGPQIGLSARIVAAAGAIVTLDRPLDAAFARPLAVILREGCDHTIATCGGRFGNARNFRGEPHLPGNDMLTQYPVAR